MNYLVVTSNGIGGSEIRLIKCWLLMKQAKLTDGLKLILSNTLLNLLNSREEFQGLISYDQDIIRHEFSNSFRENTRQLSCLLNELLVEGDRAHVLLQYPIYLKKKGVKIIYTHPATTIFGFTNLKGILGQFYFVFKAHAIDVLDPFVYTFFRTIFFYKRKNIHLTKFGVDQSLFRLADSIDYNDKSNNLVFLGRFVEGKQVLPFVKSLYDIHLFLIQKQISNYNFVIIGQGPQESEVSSHCKELINKGVPVQLHKDVNNPYPFLLSAKGFFSLQRVNNYPSQALFEGLLAGCLPVVTDCGNTRLIARKEFSFFVPESFSSKKLAVQVYDLLKLEKGEIERRSQLAIKHIKNEFHSMRMAEYYASLYNA